MKLLATILMAMALSTSAFGGAGVPPTLPPPGLPYTVGVTPPVVASFTGILTSGAVPHTVCFTDQSTGTATAWAWTFGDGGTSTLRDPCHTYTVPGVYTVTLNVTCNEGSDDIVRTNYITVTGWPVVTGVSGTISHGSTVTLTGTSFGTKATAAPVKWESGEGRTPDSAVTLAHGWSELGGTPTYSTAAGHTDLGIHMPYTASGSGRLIYNHDFSDGAYFDYWARLIKHNASWYPRQWKQWRLYGSSSLGTPQIDILGQCRNLTVQAIPVYNPAGAGAALYMGENWDDLDGRMSHWQVWVKQDKTGGTAGQLEVWIDGVKVYDKQNLKTNDAATTLGSGFRQIDFGYISVYDGENICPPTNQVSGTGYQYLDDMYFDVTKSRVELGNASTYAASTHREIQIPTAWANGSVTVTLNTGTFEPGTAYLFVTDSTGRTSAGKAVTIVAP